jgi:hypothetical protein
MAASLARMPPRAQRAALAKFWLADPAKICAPSVQGAFNLLDPFSHECYNPVTLRMESELQLE